MNQCRVVGDLVEVMLSQSCFKCEFCVTEFCLFLVVSQARNQGWG